MNVFKVAVTAVLATLAMLAFGVVAVWSLWPTTAEASVALAAHSSAWQTGKLSHCQRFGGEHVKFGQAVVTAALDLNDKQEKNLAKVAIKVEAWRTQAEATCAQTDLTTLDGGLAGLETILAQSSTAMAELRPAINEFYAELSPDQQAQLRDYVQSHQGHGQRRRGGFRGHNH
jgi:hypothetical protein